MVTCERCGTVQAGTARCLTCGEPIQDVVVRVDGHVPFVLDEQAARERLGGRWRWPRKPKLTRCWLRTERWDVRLDTRWEAHVRVRDGWALRAGWVDRWFDEVVAPPVGFEGFAGRSKQGLGHPVALPILAPTSDEVPWREALAASLRTAIPCNEVGEVWVEGEPLEKKCQVILVPLWRAEIGDRIVWISGETGRVLGQATGNRRLAIAQSFALGGLGLAALAMAAVVALPGILLWPLLAVTALGALAGFGLLVAAGLPFAWVRASLRPGGSP